MNRMMIYTVLCLASTAVAWGGWTVETVASQGDVGAGCSLAINRWGRPHISYGDKTQEQAMYASYTGSSWEFATVASDVAVFLKTALTFDAADNPHILYLDNNIGELDYAHIAGSSWVTERVDGGSGMGETTSILVWPSEPRAAYYKLGYRYAYRESGTWQREQITTDFGTFIRLFLDGANRPNVVYTSSGSKSIRRGIRINEEWSVDDISEGIDSDAFVGPDNKIHVSFAGPNNNGLTYAVSTSGGSWKFENVPGVVGSPGYTQICVNVSGDVFISYFNFNRHNLHVMIKHNGTWKHELVASGAYVGNPNSIALGQDGYPLIAFYDAGNGDLKLARYDPLSGVELTSFTAERSRAGADVRWAVSSDVGNAGYNLYRAAAGSKRAKLNSSLIIGSSPLLFRDAAVENALSYRYWLELVSLTGTKHTYGPVGLPPAREAHAFALYQNVPNPASDSTTFSFELAESAYVKLAIYDAAGRKVADVADGSFAPGKHDVLFAGDLAPGIYVYRLDAGGKSAVRKMVVAR
jgi:hypothetical protein